MENSITSFIIKNDTDKKMIIVREPEYYEFLLPQNEEVEVVVNSVVDSVSLSHSYDEEMVVVRILDYKSLYKVIYKGEDVFEKFFDPTHPFRA